jgi:hypothetical protein
MMASSLLHGRLCIIIAVIILLFLPLTFTTNNINNNNASAQPTVTPYSLCVKSYEEWNALGYWQVDPLQQCQHLKPIESSQPAQPLDCKQTNTCPIIPVPPTTIFPVPRESPKPVDWNEEDREDCQQVRGIFTAIFCAYLGKGKSTLGGLICGGVGGYWVSQCHMDYPPDLRNYGKPVTLDPNAYCDQPRYGCLRGW